MASLMKKTLATTFTILLVLSIFHQTESRMKLKKLFKAGLVLSALGSKKMPRVLPIPLPIPVRMNQEHNFGGGHFGQSYYTAQGSGYVPAYGPGPYNVPSASYSSSVYTGGLSNAYTGGLSNAYTGGLSNAYTGGLSNAYTGGVYGDSTWF